MGVYPIPEAHIACLLMLQRIQTVFLALVVALSITLFFTPLSLVLTGTNAVPPSSGAEVAHMLSVISLSKTAGGHTEQMSVSYPLIILNSMIALVALYSIFLYKNRKNQMRFCRFNLIAICLFTGVIFWMEDQLKKSHGGTLTYLVGTYIPVIQLILTFMAERAIKKDDNLVKSADRLR